MVFAIESMPLFRIALTKLKPKLTKENQNQKEGESNKE